MRRSFDPRTDQFTQGDVDRLVHRMGALAGGYSNMWGVFLTPGNRWAADPSTGEIEYDLGLAAMLDTDGQTGVMLHEIAHLRYTGNFSVPSSLTDPRDRKYAGFLINLFEDARIEKLLVGEYPGLQKYLDRLRAGYTGEKVTRQFARGKPHMQFLGAIYALLFSTAEPTVTHDKVKVAVKRYRDEILELSEASTTAKMKNGLLRKGGIFDAVRALRDIEAREAAKRAELPPAMQPGAPPAMAQPPGQPGQDEAGADAPPAMEPGNYDPGAMETDGEAMPPGDVPSALDDPSQRNLDADGNANLTVPDPEAEWQAEQAARKALADAFKDGVADSLKGGSGTGGGAGAGLEVPVGGRRESGEAREDDEDLERDDWGSDVDVDLDLDPVDDLFADPDALSPADVAALPPEATDLLDEMLGDNATDEALTPEERREAQAIRDSLHGTRTIRGRIHSRVAELARRQQVTYDDERFKLIDDEAAYLRVSAAVEQEASVLSRQMLAVLRENRYDRWSAIGYRTGGRLHVRNLAQVPAGKVEIFRQKNRPKNRQYAAALLVDVSGSMKKQMKQAVTAITLAADAMDRTTGIEFSLFAFGSQAACIKPFDYKWSARAPKLGAGAALTGKLGGGTNMKDAVERAGADMVRLYGGEDWRRLMIVITDGQPNDPTGTQRALHDLETNHDVMCVGIGIGNVGRLAAMFASWAMIDTAYELPKALTRALRDHVRRG